MTAAVEFTVSPGARTSFVLNSHPSQDSPPPPIDAEQALTHMALINTAHFLFFPAPQFQQAGKEGNWPAVMAQSP